MNKKEVMINLCLFAGVVIIFLLIMEFTLWAISPKHLYTDELKEGKEWGFYEYDRILGWKNKPNTEGDFYMVESKSYVKINSKGLRDDEHSYERENDLYRIQIYGDSYTWGFGVNKSQRFTEVFEERLLGDVEVLNFGVAGYSTDQYLLLLQTEGMKYETDLVIFAFHNDIGALPQPVRYTYPKPVYKIVNDSLVLTNVPVPEREGEWENNEYVPDKFISKVYSVLRKSRALDFFITRIIRLDPIQQLILPDEEMYGSKETSSMKYRQELNDRLLIEAKKTAEYMDAEFMLFLIPDNREFYEGLYAEDTEHVAAFAEENDFRYINSLDFLRTVGKVEKDLNFPIDSHFNVKGNEFIGLFFAGEFRNNHYPYLRQSKTISKTAASTCQPGPE